MPTPAFDPCALRRYRLFESSDVDETREMISRVMQPHSLLPAAARLGRSHMDFAKIGKLGLGTIAFGAPMQVDVPSVNGYYLMMFCVSGEAEVRAETSTLRVNDEYAVLRAPGEPFQARLSDDCEQLVMRIEPAALHRAGAQGAPRSNQRLSLARNGLRAWKEQVQLLSRSPDFLDTACTDKQVGAHVEALLLNLLACAVPGESEYEKVPALAPAFIYRAEEHMREFATTPLLLQDVAHAAGVSVRTLSAGFQRFRGISPMDRLKQFRLERARSAIQASSRQTSIATIAMDAGFSHLGRFAAQYKMQFGEYPSETQRRS